MARYGYGMSVSGSRTAVVASSGGAAPSGIPVASTSQIIVSNNGIPVGVDNSGNGAYTKDGVYNGSGGDTIYYAFNTDGNAKIALGFNFLANGGLGGVSWYVGYYYDNEFNYSFNPSTDANYIPTTGWLPSITITAA